MKRIRIADLFRPLRQSQPGSRIFFFSLLYISVVTDVLPARLFIQLSFICQVEFSFSSAKFDTVLMSRVSRSVYSIGGGGHIWASNKRVQWLISNSPKGDANAKDEGANLLFKTVWKWKKKFDRERGVYTSMAPSLDPPMESPFYVITGCCVVGRIVCLKCVLLSWK